MLVWSKSLGEGERGFTWVVYINVMIFSRVNFALFFLL